MAVFFNGRLLTTPTVASLIDDSAMANQNAAMAMNLAIIGRADGGQPQYVYKFQSPEDAKNVLKGGELLTAIEKAFAPSSETNGPQYVYVVRVDPATQAHLVVPKSGAMSDTGVLQPLPSGNNAFTTVCLKTGSSAVNDTYNSYYIKMISGAAAGETNLIEDYTGATQVANLRYLWKNTPSAGDSYEIVPASFCLVSTDYGLLASQNKIKIETGTAKGYKVTAAFGNATYLKDNLAATYFTLKYDGAAASCLAVITDSGITIKAGDLGLEVALYTCDFATYNTVGKVVDFLDAKSDLTAAYVAQYRDYSCLSHLDAQTALAISKTTPTVITANLQAVIDWINGSTEPLLEAYRPPAAASGLATFAYKHLSGGTCPTATTTDWGHAFDLLQTEDVQIVVPLSSDAAIHAMASTHVEYMSNQGAKERRTIVGGALGETIAEVAERAYNLNNDRVYLCSPGYKDYDSSSNLVTLAPYMIAALVGGMACGVNPGTPLTNKIVGVKGLEVKYKRPSETDELIEAGVLAFESTTKGYKIVQSISTWLANENYNRVELSTGIAVDYVARSVRDAVNDMIGKKGTSSSLAQIASRVDSCLKELSRPEPMGIEVITGDSDNPAYKNIKVTLEGDVVRVSFSCSPVIPINYVLISISCVPYSGSVSI